MNTENQYLLYQSPMSRGLGQTSVDVGKSEL